MKNRKTISITKMIIKTKNNNKKIKIKFDTNIKYQGMILKK